MAVYMNEDKISVTVKGNYNKKYYIDAAPNRDMGELEIFISSQGDGNLPFKDINKAMQYLKGKGVDSKDIRKVISVGRKAFRSANKKGWSLGANAWAKFMGQGGGGGINVGKHVEADT